MVGKSYGREVARLVVPGRKPVDCDFTCYEAFLSVSPGTINISFDTFLKSGEPVTKAELELNTEHAIELAHILYAVVIEARARWIKSIEDSVTSDVSEFLNLAVAQFRDDGVSK